MPLLAQPVRPASPRIVQAVDETRLVTLRGNTHALARAEYDQGAAPADLPMERMLLLLSRGPERDAALERFLAEQQDPASVHFHQWLTPEEFGDQFGPAPEDIEKVTGWLTARGFRVDRVADGRQVVEFSGAAGQVERALHTEIHGYLVRGERHWANAQDPQIPAALSPAVVGIVSLHNFLSKAMRRDAGAFRRRPGEATWESVNPRPTYTTAASTTYAMAPYDFATIYNVLPLWNSGIDGTGQSVAIVARSNIDPTDVTRFRAVFGLPANAPTITLNGADPGLATDEGEAISDVEWVGAVAKGASVILVVSKTTSATDGVDLSTEYIVDRNLAPVLSSSYGSCENEMSTSDLQFYLGLWQQAAAEGITVIVGAGDGGSGFCDVDQPYAVRGLQVNGMASPPYDVAVGGTDFDDVLDGTAVAYWSSTNNPITLASAKSYIPEMAWNDSCAGSQVVVFMQSYFGDPTPEALCNDPNADSSVIDLLYVASGSGGASTAYSKPAWQSGVSGIPADGQRDLPDVSLFAGDGFFGHYYPICQADQSGPCNPSSTGGMVASGGGGTSYSAQAFAGVMALVNQKVGSRQGLANSVLYRLASAQYGSGSSPSAAEAKTCDSSLPVAAGNSCVFYDITSGTNDVPCSHGTANCFRSNAADAYGLLSTSSTALVVAYPASPGYDLSTGLGTLNVANLVQRWNALVTAPVLSVAKSHSGNFTEGQTGAAYTVTVSNAAATGPTVGTVTVVEIVPTGLALVSMAGPGWTCSVGACTRSDALAAGASYPAIAVTVNVAANAPSQLTNRATVSGGSSVSATASDVTTVAAGPASTNLTLTANPATVGATGTTTLTASLGIVVNTPPTGTVAFNLGGTRLGWAPVGVAGVTAQASLAVAGSQFTVGGNTVTATYGGDAKFAGSTATVVVTLTSGPAITPGGVVNAASFLGGSVSPGEIVSIFGAGIGPATPAFLILDASNKVSTSIGGVTVSFNGFLAPLTYAGAAQINAVVPYEIAGNSAPFVQVSYGGQTSSQLALQLATAAPAIFTLNGSGSGAGAVLNADSSVNTQSNPAAKGTVIQIFMTGEGLTNPAQATGSVTSVIAPGTAQPTPAPQQAVSVAIGGQPAILMFAGEAPYTVAGVLQVNAAVPAAAASGADSLVVKVGNQSSQSGVTVWVQ
jgi:uncharacterized protein (TIGR03437 family)